MAHALLEALAGTGGFAQAIEASFGFAPIESIARGGFKLRGLGLLGLGRLGLGLRFRAWGLGLRAWGLGRALGYDRMLCGFWMRRRYLYRTSKDKLKWRRKEEAVLIHVGCLAYSL